MICIRNSIIATIVILKINPILYTIKDSHFPSNNKRSLILNTKQTSENVSAPEQQKSRRYSISIEIHPISII